MSEYINLNLALWNHLRRKKLHRKLGYKGSVSLLNLWLSTAKYKPSGVLEGYSVQDVESYADWTEKPGSFFDVVLDTGFLEKIDNGYRVAFWGTIFPAPKFPDKGKRPSGPTWKRIKAIVLKRDNYICSYCGATHEHMHCDHIVPIARGGGNDFDNLTTSCRKCNLAKGSKLLEEWLNE